MITSYSLPQETPDGFPLDAAMVADPWQAAGIEEGEHRDSWLLNYIDILTIILTLFVLLLALQPKGQLPQETKPPAPSDAIAESVDNIPASLPATEATPEETQPPMADTPVLVLPEQAERPSAPYMPEITLALPQLFPQPAGLIEEAAPLAMAESGTPPQQMDAAVEPIPAEEAPEMTPADSMIAQLEAAGLDERIQVSPQARGIHLEIRDSILFTPASAVLTDQGQALLDGLALIFMRQNYTLSVEGHTDDRPISNTRFPSNWELSTGRASQVARSLIERGIVSERLQAVGYADTRPVSDNQTPEGRARNRRVSLVLQIPGMKQP